MSEPYYLPKLPDQTVIKLNYERAVEALGKVCVAFQALETDFKSAIGELVDPIDVHLGMIITAQLSFKGVLDLFEALFDHRLRDPDLQKKLGKFLGQCKAAEDRRNQIIHSQWLPDSIEGKGALRVKHSSRRELKSTVELLSQSDLKEVADKFEALGRELYKDWFPRIRAYSLPRMPTAKYLPKHK
jgi:hypothetical protein